VIVDYALIQQADVRVNRAGYGDLLPLQTTLNDWRLAAAASRTDPVDPEIEASSERIMRQAMAAAPEIGSLSQRGIETLMRLTEASTALMLTHASRPLNAGSEHLFAWTLESLTGRHFLHGEIVALGIVISSWLQGRDHAALTGALDQARVIYHPERLEIEWAEIEQTLRGIQPYNREVRHFNTVYDDVEWTPELLRDARDLVYSSPRRDAP
jgi:glycerol dehydrogenase-like iron-containing ADH family enzyme